MQRRRLTKKEYSSALVQLALRIPQFWCWCLIDGFFREGEGFDHGAIFFARGGFAWGLPSKNLFGFTFLQRGGVLWPPSLVGRKGLGLAGHTEVCRTKEVLGCWTEFWRSTEQRLITQRQKKSRTRTTLAARARLCNVCSWSVNARCARTIDGTSLRIFRLCVTLWKDAPEPTVKHCLGRQFDVVQECITIQNFGQMMVSQCVSSGISQDSPHCSTATKSKSSCQKWAMSLNNLQDGSSSCSTTCHGDLKTMNRNANLTPTSFLFMRERFPPRRWSFVGPGSEKKWVFYFLRKTPRRMGKRRWIDDDDQIQRKPTPSFPSHECTVVPRNGQKQRRWKIINTFLRWWWIEIFSQLLQIISSVSTEQSQIWENNTIPSVSERWDLFGRKIWPIVCADKFVDESTYTFERWSCARRSAAKVPRTSGKVPHNKIGSLRFCIDAGFLTTAEVGLIWC